ncbi:hypothetical protein [Granulicella aggregans]|nr:hypothetical protein [Granulicella aggregans]
MVEYIELRVWEENAHLIFREDEGEKLSCGLTRKVILDVDDHRLPEIIRVHNQLRAERHFLYGGHFLCRKYKSSELEKAEFLTMWIAPSIREAGEDYGTVYDEETACPLCGSGAHQLSALFLNLNKISRSRDLLGTDSAVEKVVSQRFLECVRDEELTGLDFRPVHAPVRGAKFKSRKGTGGPWHQMLVTSQSVSVVPPTRLGELMVLDLRPACPLGHCTDRWLLSEVTAEKSGWDGADVFQSLQRFGIRQEHRRPYTALFCTQRFRQMVKRRGLKGVTFEVAHLI